MNWRETARVRRASLRKAFLFSAAAVCAMMAIAYFYKSKSLLSLYPFVFGFAVLITSFVIIEIQYHRYNKEHDFFLERRLRDRRGSRDRRSVPRPDSPDRRREGDRRLSSAAAGVPLEEPEQSEKQDL